MQKAELRVSDTKKDTVRSSPIVEHNTGRSDDGAEERRARKLALVLMAASSLLMIGLILGLWLTWSELL